MKKLSYFLLQILVDASIPLFLKGYQGFKLIKIH
jgi:hypothetical protein